jgi:hypothetical protein
MIFFTRNMPTHKNGEKQMLLCGDKLVCPAAIAAANDRGGRVSTARCKNPSGDF